MNFSVRPFLSFFIGGFGVIPQITSGIIITLIPRDILVQFYKAVYFYYIGMLPF